MGKVGRRPKEDYVELSAKQKKFLKCYEETLGLMALACKNANICQASYYNWLKEDSKRGEIFRERVQEIQEFQGDLVENRLLHNIKSGDVTSTIFYCKTKLRNRGYNQTIDTNVNIESTDDIKVSDAVGILTKGLNEEDE